MSNNREIVKSRGNAYKNMKVVKVKYFTRILWITFCDVDKFSWAIVKTKINSQ
jgi:hypothetical protein